MRWATWRGSNGAPIVATARTSAMRPAATSAAAPPRLWPMRISGGPKVLLTWSAALTRSSTLEEKVASANSPPLAPRPVKSKRSAAIPRAASHWLMYAAALESFEQVKQCAKIARARGAPAGSSRRPASSCPAEDGKRTVLEAMIDTPSQWVVRWAPYITHGPVLDVASGSGRHALFFARRGLDVVAVDREPM